MKTDSIVKPDPTAAIMIAEKFGVSPCDCAFVGDSDVDVITAKNAGMFSVAVSWGYRDRKCLVACAPDAIADKPSELADILLR